MSFDAGAVRRRKADATGRARQGRRLRRQHRRYAASYGPRPSDRHCARLSHGLSQPGHASERQLRGTGSVQPDGGEPACGRRRRDRRQSARSPAHDREGGRRRGDLERRTRCFKLLARPPDSRPNHRPTTSLSSPIATWRSIFDPQRAAKPETIRTQPHVLLDRSRLPADPVGAYQAVRQMANNVEARTAGSAALANNLAARARRGARRRALRVLPGAARALGRAGALVGASLAPRIDRGAEGPNSCPASDRRRSRADGRRIAVPSGVAHRARHRPAGASRGLRLFDRGVQRHLQRTGAGRRRADQRRRRERDGDDVKPRRREAS